MFEKILLFPVLTDQEFERLESVGQIPFFLNDTIIPVESLNEKDSPAQ